MVAAGAVSVVPQAGEHAARARPQPATRQPLSRSHSVCGSAGGA